jgi:adenine-specific DNA-methyltransferase
LFTAERIEELRRILPEAFADGKVNWATLRESLGDWAEDEGEHAEHFGLTWPGKRDARRMAALPSQGTLVPVPGEGIDEETTRNIFIEGDNLEVLKLIQKSYAGRVKMIYIDPPYNTGNDFIYEDDFSEPIEAYLKRTGQLGDDDEPLSTNTRADGRFHSKWLSMMYPRLRLARQLLADTGAIFISLDDTEVANARMILNELFGEENFVAQLIWEKSKKGDAKLIAIVHEYVLVYAANKARLIESGGWRRRKPGIDAVLEHYQSLRAQHQGDHDAIQAAMRAWYKSLPKEDERRSHEHYKWSDDRGLYFAADFAGPDDGRKSRPRYDIIHPVTRKSCAKPSTGWRWEEPRTVAALAERPPRIHFGVDETTIPCRKSYLTEIDTEPFNSVFYRDGRAATLEVEGYVGKGVFPFPKSADILQQFIALASKDEDLVADFFCGSGTFGHAVWNQNRADGQARRFLCVQLPEQTEEGSAARQARFADIAAIARRRLRAVQKDLRADRKTAPNEDLGFRVLKLARSSFVGWQDYDGDNLNKLTDLFEQAEQPLAEGWIAGQLLTEVMLIEGFPLDSRLDRIALKRNDVRRVTSDAIGHALVACFDERVFSETLKALEVSETDIFVCLDSALSDKAKLELADRCLLKTI